MENQPLVSVIIPVFNVEKYLKECIDSVVSQTYQNIEILLVDDGSADSSGEICDEYAKLHPNIKVIHKENGGLSSARNCGFSESTGDFVYFLDSDDYIDKQAIEKLLAVACENDAEAVFFDAENFADADFQTQIKQNYIRKSIYETEAGIHVLEQMQQKCEYHSAVPLLFLKKDFLVKNNLSFANGIVFEDMLYTYEVFCLAQRVAQCNKAFYKRRYRADSIMTSKKSKKYFDSLVEVYNLVKDFSHNNGISDTAVAKKYITRIAFNVFNNYFALTKADKKLCRDTFKVIKADILSNKAFGDKALEMKCYSNLHWLIYKLYEKTFGRF